MFILKGANEHQDNVSVLKRLTKIATHPTIHRRDKHEKERLDYGKGSLSTKKPRANEGFSYLLIMLYFVI